ncbi:hypothetical protein PsorP6_000775 [Peronosclerospora sorghi]|uniref:Uncharacterized protein n=1 Tax=Peronosclerospora sorghi TaxID=230839 RepID=A0ACC0WRW4_9STRA|nr:hypothetical protein PsorP6_000775 [Peronosclerospora sorghi]
MFGAEGTDKIPHFGHRVTSRAESAHRLLKQPTPSSMGNLLIPQGQQGKHTEDREKDEDVSKVFPHVSVVPPKH